MPSTPERPRAADAERRARLAQLRAQAERIILARQDPDTGLLPASTAITVHGDYTHAWVRDNVYSIYAVWALALAHRGPEPATARRLEANVERLMRGLLAAMMRQAHKVERFKHTQDPLDALHAKYDTRTGEPVVGDADWGHLQIDATAIFLLALAHMSEAGLAIVRTPAELALVQNLVYYLAPAWRTPDFGIWERGHKRNEGVAELNASSLGMAKAALEAIADRRLLPGAPPVFVAGDDIAHARKTLEALLPRESASKETDAALLAIVGFPAFAIDDAALAARTRSEIVQKLQGRYGCKRFLRDGHQTAIEDHSRLHYEPGELSRFEHIESEWPLFFTYLLIDAVMRGDAAEADAYRARLDGLMQRRDGEDLLPELYVVPPESIEAERARPHSQDRVPNENVPLVWAQSLYIVGVLLQEGLLAAADLHPHPRPPVRREPCVQVVLVADSELLRARLAAHGIASQTPRQLRPLKLHEAADLSQALAQLGAEPSLGLGGRPPQRLGSLATGRVFNRGNDEVVVFPSLFDRRGFYLRLDNRLLLTEVDAEIGNLRRQWNEAGEPVLALRLSEPMLEGDGAAVLLRWLGDLPSREGVRVVPMADALRVAARRTLEGLRLAHGRAADGDEAEPAEPEAPSLPDWDEAATRPLGAVRRAALHAIDDPDALERRLAASRNPYEQIELLARLARRTDAAAVAGRVRAAYARAAGERRWGVVRRAAGLMQLHDERLEDAVLRMLVRGKRISIGRPDGSPALIERPLGQAQLVELMRRHAGEDPGVHALTEELVLLLGTLVKAEPELFEGMLTLRPAQLLALLTASLAREHALDGAGALDHLLDLSPQAILARLREVVGQEKETAVHLARLQTLHWTGPDTLVQITFRASADPVLPMPPGDWAAWREATGTILRVPPDFHERVWELLRHCQGLWIGDPREPANRLDSRLGRADMTAAEPGFARLVDELLNRIQEPGYRQLCVETLLALSDIVRANPDLSIDGTLALDVVIAQAVALAAEPAGAEPDAAPDAQAWLAFHAAPPHRVANAVMASFASMLEPRGAV